MKQFLRALLLSVCVLVPVCALAGQDSPQVVRYVVDGDTLILENNEWVRLIGIDTPEIHDDQHRNAAHAARYGLDARVVDEYVFKARRFLRDAVLGQRVRLEYDGERFDKFGRTLAYVYRVSDDLFLNAELTLRGYGFAYTRFPFKYEDQFRDDQSQARRNHQGLWG